MLYVLSGHDLKHDPRDGVAAASRADDERSEYFLHVAMYSVLRSEAISIDELYVEKEREALLLSDLNPATRRNATRVS